MNLYRMTYIREGKPRGTPFTAQDAEKASRLAEKWVAGFGGKLLTVRLLRPVGQPELRLVA